MVTTKPLNIAIDAGDLAPTSKVRSGISRIVRSFISSLVDSKTPVHIDYYFFSSDKIPLIHSPTIQYHQLPSKGFGSFFLPLSIHRRKTDVFIGFSQYIPRLPRITKAILVVHDIAFTRFGQLYTSARELESMTIKSIQRAHHIVVFSKTVYDDLRKIYPIIDPKIISILQPGLDHIPVQAAPVGIGYPFFLTVGVIKPIKRVEMLIEAFSMWKNTYKLPHQLLCIGYTEPSYKQKLEKLPFYSSFAQAIVWKELITDEELISYYQQATAFLIASYDEGICLPLQEALSQGTQAIAMSNAVFQEIHLRFPQLQLVSNLDSFVEAMQKSVNNKLSKNTYTIPTWGKFTEDLLAIASQISDNAR